MENQEWSLSAGLSHELELAVKRAGGLPKDIKALANGDAFAKVLPFLRGEAEINIVKYRIDLDADPFCPKDWTVEEHRRGGIIEYTPDKAKLFLAEEQKNGDYLEGHKLRKKLKDLPVANANLLDWYLANPYKIPEEWKEKVVFFWGTIYRSSGGGLFVRCLGWGDGRWGWDCGWLDDDLEEYGPALLLAS